VAEIKKFKTAAVGAIFRHANRTARDGHTHSNESIDLNRTKFNYHLKNGDVADWRERLDDVFHLKRKDIITFAEAVVTLPEDVRPEDERAFFQSCYDFFSKDFKEQNVMYAVVHKDEVTPHLHLGFIPVAEGDFDFQYRAKSVLEKWKAENSDKEVPKERVCAKEVINRYYLQTMHERLQAHVDDDLGYHVSVMNGATLHGNKTVLEMKVNTLEEKEKKLQKSIKEIQSDAKVVKEILKSTGISPDKFDLYPLLQQIEMLQERNRTLMNIIINNNLSFKPSEIRAKPLERIKSSSVSVYQGSCVDEKIPDNAVVFIELPKNKKESPQQKLINEDFDLRNHVAFARRAEDENIVIKKSRVSEKVFVMIKTDDNEQNTITRLIEMETALREIEHLHERKIYMDRLSNDKYNLAKSILASNELQASYFEQKSVLDKFFADEDKEKENNNKKIKE